MDPASKVRAFVDGFKPSLTAFSTCAVLFEIAVLAWLKRPWKVKPRLMSVACFLIASTAGGLFQYIVGYQVHAYVYRFRVFDFGFAWYGWVLCFLLIDSMFYVTHRMHHRVRLLWCVHSVHHSAEQFELTTGIRGSLFDTASQFAVYAWLPLVGIHPLMYVATDLIFKFLIFVYHTELVGRVGPLEHILVTPSAHRVHHGKNTKYLDRNYGGVFILLDKLLGTYQREEDHPEYGVRNKPATNNILDTQLGELAALWKDVVAAPSMASKLAYVLKPPGWRHDGRGETSEELREERGSMIPEVRNAA